LRIAHVLSRYWSPGPESKEPRGTSHHGYLDQWMGSSEQDGERKSSLISLLLVLGLGRGGLVGIPIYV